MANAIKKILLIGETWMNSATHYKGFDQFGSVTFHSGADPLVKALADNWQVSGVTSILSGVRQGFSYGYTAVPTGVLTGQGSINGGGSRRARRQWFECLVENGK